jgi:PhoH-like ATPase
MVEKIFVLDTSVIVSDSRALHNFIGNKIVIPYAVYEEVDTFKKGISTQAHAARTFFRILNRIIESNKYLDNFVSLTENIKIKITGGDTKLLPREFDKKKRDNQIIATVLKVQKEENKWYKKKKEVILVSKDAGLRIAANALRIKTEDYKADKIQNKDIFAPNYPKVQISNSDMNLLGGIEGKLFYPNRFTINSRIVVNDVFDCVVESGDKISLLQDNKVGDIRAKNIEQEHALWLLNNPKIQLVGLSGIAGAGKTLLAIASGLDQVIGANPIYKKIVIVRPVISVGKELGFLPGEIDEKMEPWMKPIYDAIYVVLKDTDKSKVQYLFDSGVIEVAPLSYIRGRSIHNAFIYIDESQNISKSEIKTILTRTGLKSKVVVAGDSDQIDVPYLNKYSCGLAHVINTFQGQSIFGHCNMLKSERSQLAELSAKLL